MKVKIPGWLWVLGIVVAIGVLQGDMFAGKEWAPAVVLILTAILKAVQTYPARFGLTDEDLHPADEIWTHIDTRGDAHVVKRTEMLPQKSHFWRRFLLG